VGCACLDQVNEVASEVEVQVFNGRIRQHELFCLCIYLKLEGTEQSWALTLTLPLEAARYPRTSVANGPHVYRMIFHQQVRLFRFAANQVG
jgi:hypothetical protein